MPPPASLHSSPPAGCHSLPRPSPKPGTVRVQSIQLTCICNALASASLHTASTDILFTTLAMPSAPSPSRYPSHQLRPGTPLQPSIARLPLLTPRQQQQPYSSTSTSKLPSPNAPSGGPRRISEEPDFEDLIMRGDTLRMTLTPSRFRQSSKDGSQAVSISTPSIH